MNSEQSPDSIWSDPERVLAPSKEDLLIRGLEEISEEQLFACWADEALQVCLDLGAADSSNGRELFLSCRGEINQYLTVLDEITCDILSLLQTAGRECDPALLRSPRTDIRNNLAVELGTEEEPGCKSELASRQNCACDYTEDRVVRFLSRFSGPRDELVPRYPGKRLRRTLRETRRELVRCSDRADERWNAEIALDPEPDSDLATPARRRAQVSPLRFPLQTR